MCTCVRFYVQPRSHRIQAEETIVLLDSISTEAEDLEYPDLKAR